MTPEELLKLPALLNRRVRIKNDPRVTGEVFDVTDDGLILWVDTANGCHVSDADYLEAAS